MLRSAYGIRAGWNTVQRKIVAGVSQNRIRAFACWVTDSPAFCSTFSPLPLLDCERVPRACRHLHRRHEHCFSLIPGDQQHACAHYWSSSEGQGKGSLNLISPNFLNFADNLLVNLVSRRATAFDDLLPKKLLAINK